MEAAETLAALDAIGFGLRAAAPTSEEAAHAGVRWVVRTRSSRRLWRRAVWTAPICLRAGNPLQERDCGSGRYWARTSDPQLVELVLSQLS